eukprot:2610303-Prorocentrum_lima.AAC.1
MEGNGESLTAQLKKLKIGKPLGVTDRAGENITELYQGYQVLSSQMASLGCSSLRAPSIFKRFDFDHGHHLVIDDVCDLKSTGI